MWLGMLLNEQGDPQGALIAWQHAANSDDPVVTPVAMYAVGGLLEDRNDLKGARIAYRHAVDSNHPEAAPKAANNLGILRAQQGDVAGAQAAYQYAIDSKHPRRPQKPRTTSAISSLSKEIRMAPRPHTSRPSTAATTTLPRLRRSSWERCLTKTET